MDPRKGCFPALLRTENDSSLRQLPHHQITLLSWMGPTQSPEGSRREASLTLEAQAISCRQNTSCTNGPLGAAGFVP